MRSRFFRGLKEISRLSRKFWSVSNRFAVSATFAWIALAGAYTPWNGHDYRSSLSTGVWRTWRIPIELDAAMDKSLFHRPPLETSADAAAIDAALAKQPDIFDRISNDHSVEAWMANSAAYYRNHIAFYLALSSLLVWTWARALLWCLSPLGKLAATSGVTTAPSKRGAFLGAVIIALLAANLWSNMASMSALRRASAEIDGRADSLDSEVSDVKTQLDMTDLTLTEIEAAVTR